MNKPAKNKITESFADLIADSKPMQKEVAVGNHMILIQELSGRARFALAEREEESKWDTMLWVCMQAIVDPVPDNIEALELLNPEWIIELANEVMRISGVTDNEADVVEAENGSAAVSDIGGL